MKNASRAHAVEERYEALQQQQLDDDGAPPLSEDIFSHYPSDVYYDPSDRTIVETQKPKQSEGWLLSMLKTAASYLF